MLKAAQTPVPCPDLFRHLPTKPTESDFGTRVVSLLVQQLETDEDFAFLRDAPGFQALIRQYK